jgi:hypothetical protein
MKNILHIAVEDQSGSEPAKFNPTNTQGQPPAGFDDPNAAVPVASPVSDLPKLPGDGDQSAPVPAANHSSGGAPAAVPSDTTDTTVENVELPKETFRNADGKTIEEVKAEELAAEKAKFAAAEDAAVSDQIARASAIGYFVDVPKSFGNNLASIILALGPLDFLVLTAEIMISMGGVEKSRRNIIREVAFRDSGLAVQKILPDVVAACSYQI